MHALPKALKKSKTAQTKRGKKKLQILSIVSQNNLTFILCHLIKCRAAYIPIKN